MNVMCFQQLIGKENVVLEIKGLERHSHLL